MISAVVKFLLNPWWPVEQNTQPTAHPACEEMQRVALSSSGINTVSTASPPPTSKSHFIVPSLEFCLEITFKGVIVQCYSSKCLKDLARSVI